MLEGVMLLWFVLTGLSVLYVAIDIRSTPESPVLKWGFVLLTAYIGPLGAFLYVLGCREPLSGLHERYVAVRWRQVLGSTMHCMAGDGVGILVGAVIASVMMLMGLADVALEYVLGFGFGWTIFQALFMRSEAGGSYKAALRNTFIPELLSMNALMAGMVPTMMLAMRYVRGSHDPTQPAFWFVMSMALLVGFVTAYPMNWWLVSRHMKHGMMTMRAPQPGHTMAMQGSDSGDAAQREASAHAQHGATEAMNAVMGHESVEPKAMEQGMGENVSSGALAGMALVSLALFAAGLGIAYYFGGLGQMS